MLAYTKRMNDIRRIRGINTMRQVEPLVDTPSLWINAGKDSLITDMLEDKKQFTTHNKMTKSLGSIKLEPLLGSRRMSGENELVSNTYLHTHKVDKELSLVSVTVYSY